MERDVCLASSSAEDSYSQHNGPTRSDDAANSKQAHSMKTNPLCQLCTSECQPTDVICHSCENYLCYKCSVSTPGQTLPNCAHKCSKSTVASAGRSPKVEKGNQKGMIPLQNGISTRLEQHGRRLSGSFASAGVGELEHRLNIGSPASLHVESDENIPRSLLILDGSEKLQVKSLEELIEGINCRANAKLKVISIFGNTGDGKSHTLNHTFFEGKQIFKVSSSQKSCTVGVWVAYDQIRDALIVDTEGLLGASENTNRRMRLLLKVLAISDIVLYRTRAERLHSDMFTFLGDASDAYLKYFSKDLRCVQERCKMDVPLCSLGPAVIIFHETLYTEPLGSGMDQSQVNDFKAPEDVLREHFVNFGRDPQAFSSMSYVGTKTESCPTDFKVLQDAIDVLLKNNAVRSRRPLSVIFNALKVLNDKFGGEIDNFIPSSFPDAYFTCGVRCRSCNGKCELSMGHEKDLSRHHCSSRCKYQAQYDNRVFICKSCYDSGLESIVSPKTSSSVDTPWMGLAKYAWSGYVLECPHCGVIYRSRQFWYGNRDPVETDVRTEIVHVWPGTKLTMNNQNAARRLLDGVGAIAETIGTVSAKPTKAVSSWVSDKVAPEYWVPNYKILACYACGSEFLETDTKHHCRSCGHGFCDDCTSHRMVVSERGWGSTPVRVCDSCYNKAGAPKEEDGLKTAVHLDDLVEAINDDPDLETGEIVSVRASDIIPSSHPQQLVTGRKVTERVRSTISYISSSLDYPKELVVDAARPSYWVPDGEIVQCRGCERPFKQFESKHHCRGCGQGFCDKCSSDRVGVPSRGWDYPVRVCKACFAKKDTL